MRDVPGGSTCGAGALNDPTPGGAPDVRGMFDMRDLAIVLAHQGAVSEMYREAIRWWARYLRVFAQNPPWGITGKFAIGVPGSVGEDVVKFFGLPPKEVVDAIGPAPV